MEPIEGLTPVAAGEFAQTPFAHILVYLQRRNMSGTLRVAAGDREDRIYFQLGVPAKVLSEGVGDRLGSVLIDLDLIDAKQLKEAEEERTGRDTLVGEYLVRNGAIDTSGLIRALREQMVRRLVGVFALPDARYAFYENVNLLMGHGADELFPLDTGTLLMAGLRAHGGRMNLDPILLTLSGRWISLEDVEPLRRFRFTPEERAVCISLLESPRPAESVFRDRRVDPQLTRRVIYALLITKQLTVAESAEAAERPDTGPVSARQFDSVAPPPAEVRLSEDPKTAELRKSVAEKATAMSSQNYFEMLELPFGAPADEVRKAFFRQAKIFHPDKVVGTSAGDLKDTLQYIFSNLSEAHSTLIDLEAREDYMTAVAEGDKRTATADSEEEEEVRAALEAESLFQKALVLLRRDDFTKAAELVDEARVLNPHEGEYNGAWAYLQWRLRPREVDAEDLLSKLRGALAASPNSERLHIYLARMTKAIGYLEDSAAHYQAVLNSNPRNIEAAREIRLYEKRKAKAPAKKPKGLLGRFLK